MIQLSQKGLLISDHFDLAKFQQAFSENHCVVLPSLIQEDLLGKIIAQVELAEFFENEHRGLQKEVFATDLTIQGENSALHQINFLLNNKTLFNIIQEITQVKGIERFSGRIYRNMPNTGHHLDWHDDTEDPTRLVAMSMSLNKNAYSGGVFQLQDKKTKKIISEVGSGKAGDTHVFRVSPLLEHRVTPTTGAFPRTAAAGWFTSEKKSLFPFLKK